MFSVSEYSHIRTDQRWLALRHIGWGIQREGGFICITKSLRGDMRDGGGQQMGVWDQTSPWSALVSPGQLEWGLGGVATGQCEHMPGVTSGQHMVSTCQSRDTREGGADTGLVSPLCITGQSNAPIGRKISQICGNSGGEIVTEPRAQPALARDWEDKIFWFVLIWGIIINCFVFSLSASPISNILNL